MQILLKPLLVLFLLIMLQSCNQADPENPSESPKIATKDSIVDTLKPAIKIQIHYKMLVLTDSIRKRLSKDFPENQLATVCALNRIDLFRIHRVDSLIIPDTLSPNFIDYSPFPDSVSQYTGIHKIIVISYPLQAFGIYDQGILQRWGPVCMGKKATPTPTGLFHTNWKSKSQISTDNPDWILPWYFNLVNNTGVSFHQFDLPGFPASHSCIRLGEEDAKWIYSFADQWKLDDTGRKIIAYGTPVIIFGEYGFGKQRPWYGLVKNPKANQISSDSLEKIMNPYREFIEERQANRDSLEIKKTNLN